MKNQALRPTNANLAYEIKNTFSLKIKQNSKSAKIKMMMLREPINTQDIPHTLKIVENHLPTVLTTQCFNEDRIPFHQEIKSTEIGHLFEHILLEYMCQLKINNGHENAEFTGRTRWNWECDPRGLFHIHINSNKEDFEILSLALEKSIALLKKILSVKSETTIHDNQLNKEYLNYTGLKNGKRKKETKS